MNIHFVNTCLISATAMIVIFALASIMQYSKAQSPHLLQKPVYQNEIRTGMTVFSVTGPEGEVPQKLIEELNNKGGGDERR